MESNSLRDRLEAFFEEFIDQLLLKDFESILTVNHPYRHRDEIVDLARAIAFAPGTMQVIAEEYLAAGMGADIDIAWKEAESDLLAIETMFGQIGEMFERIETFRRQLEARVRNTIKYAERGAEGLVARAADLVKRLDTLLADGRHDGATLEWSVEPLRSPWSEHHHAPARQPRRPVEARALEERPEDRLYELRKRLKIEYIGRIAPKPEDVRRFLETQVPPAGTKEARFMQLRTVDDFLAFDAARRYALTGSTPREVSRSFKLEAAPEAPPHDSEWLRCSNFVVHRAAAAERTLVHA